MIGIPRSEWGNQAQWAVTAPLLFASLLGTGWALHVAAGLCALSILYYGARLRSVRPYRVQVRLGVLAILLTGLVPGLGAIVWLPAIGTSAQLLVGYCPMARCLDLMPWNRTTSLGFADVYAVVTRPPGNDGLFSLRTGQDPSPGDAVCLD